MSVNTELQKLLTKMSGEPLESDSNSDLLAKIVDAYSGGGSAGNLEYESGNFTYEHTIGDALTVSFHSSHTSAPVFFCVMRDTTGLSYADIKQDATFLECGFLFSEVLTIEAFEDRDSSPYHVNGVGLRVKGPVSATAHQLDRTPIFYTIDGATKWSECCNAAGLMFPSTIGFQSGDYKWIAIWKSWNDIYNT